MQRKNVSQYVILKRVFHGLNARYYLNGYDLILYESKLDFLNNHRALNKKGFLRFNPVNYRDYIKIDFKNYQNQLSGQPLAVIDNFYNQLSPIYKINIGTLDHPYHVRE